MPDTLSAILETAEAERLATGFEFTEGPLWHTDGFYIHALEIGADGLMVRRRIFTDMSSDEPEAYRTA